MACAFILKGIREKSLTKFTVLIINIMLQNSIDQSKEYSRDENMSKIYCSLNEKAVDNNNNMYVTKSVSHTGREEENK